MFVEELNLSLIAPSFIQQRWTEAEVLGSTVWLWMNSNSHHELPLHTLSAALLPAIKTRQFILASEASKPVFFMSWANMSPEAEARYLNTHQLLMKREDWHSGERMWVIDWVAPFGHTHQLTRFLFQQFMASLCMRSLHHRSEERGRRVRYFFGNLVSPQERRLWKQAHPLPDSIDVTPQTDPKIASQATSKATLQTTSTKATQQNTLENTTEIDHE